MNVLYIAPYSQVDMWGESAYRFLLALNQIQDIDLACRPISFNNLHREKEGWVQALEQKVLPNYDKVIQFCPPQYYVGGSNSVGVCIVEPYLLKERDWTRQLNCMSSLIVSSEYEQSSLKDSGVKTLINVIENPTLNISFCTKQPPIREIGKDFIFYWVGEYNTRTDYQNVVRAFHTEFKHYEDVQLAMYFVCDPTQEMAKKISEEINHIKLNLNKYSNPSLYKSDSITVGKRPDEIFAYHEYCDCMIDISKGGVNPHVGDAINFNNRTILNKWSGLSQYSSYRSSTCCEVTICPIVSAPYSCDSLWSKVNIRSLQKQMRQAHKTKTLENDMQDFSLDNISNKIKKVLSQ